MHYCKFFKRNILLKRENDLFSTLKCQKSLTKESVEVLVSENVRAINIEI